MEISLLEEYVVFPVAPLSQNVASDMHGVLGDERGMRITIEVAMSSRLTLNFVAMLVQVVRR